MASRKENLKSLFSNTRTRVIIIFTAILLLSAVSIGVIKFISASNVGKSGESNLSGVPGIQSIPGALEPTVQYAKLQEEQNISQAKAALQQGSSAIPTIIRTQTLASGEGIVGPQQGSGGVNFSTLAREEEGGSQQSLWIQNLKDQYCSKTIVTQVVQEGATLSDLKKACTCIQLYDVGYKINDLDQVCSCKDLKAAGYNAQQFKSAGYTAGQLRDCGFDACELRSAGFTAQEMKDGGFSDGELKGSGFSDDDISRANGLPDGITASDVRKAGCELTALEKLRAAGVSAGAIRQISGCSAAQLKAAGYSALDLKNAGFTAAELAKAGFTPAQLRQAGYSARDLLNAGFTPDQLAQAGYTPQQITAAETELPPGITADEVKSAGCSVAVLKKERLAGVSANLIEQNANCSAQALKDAGFSNDDLANAGFTPADINQAGSLSSGAIGTSGCDPTKLHALFQQGISALQIHKTSGCSASALKAAGYSAADLAAAGFTPQDLLAAGFTPAQIKQAEDGLNAAIRAAGCDPTKLKALYRQGVAANLIHQLNGCSAAALKAAGYSAQDLAAAGFSPQDLQAAGFSPEQIKEAQDASDAAIRAAGCDPTKLNALLQQGVSALRIHQINGCSANALKAAGYSAEDLAAAGFTPKDLLSAGFLPSQIKQAADALNAAIRAAGCDPAKLVALYRQGVAAQLIHKLNGCSAAALKAAGYSANDLTNAGFSPQDLQAAGFSPDEINAAQAASDAAIRAAGCDLVKLHALFEQGVSPQLIHQMNGCLAAALKAAGYSAGDLLKAGFAPKDLQGSVFTPDQIQQAQVSSDDAIKAAGCDPVKLHALFEQGVSATRINQLNGCNAAALKAAGYGAKDLLAAGFTPQDLMAAGFTPQDLTNAGIQPSAIIAAGRPADCSVSLLKTAKADGVSASTIKKTLGCSAEALAAAGYTAAELKDAGFTAAELKASGFTPAELKAAGYSAKDLRDAGFSAAELKAAGFSPKQLRAAGFSAADLKTAGFTAAELKDAGFSAQDLKDGGFTAAQLQSAGYTPTELEKAGFSAGDLKNAGLTDNQLKQAGFTDAQIEAANAELGQIPSSGITTMANGSQVAGLANANIPGVNPSNIAPFPSLQKGIAGQNNTASDLANSQQLQQILKRQNQQLADQRYQQQIQQRMAQMLGAANQDIQDWAKAPSQANVGGGGDEKGAGTSVVPSLGNNSNDDVSSGLGGTSGNKRVLIKTGDIIFAVLDTAVNSDQPGPILATVVSGQFKGARLIGSFHLANNSNAMTINFTTMSVPGADKSTAINAFAIDPNTARTALASSVNNHYLLRYGSLFASSFLEGFGNAFQSANTTVTIGGTAGGDNITVQNGIGRSTLENAVIGMATLGKTWGQVAQQQFSTPVTVEVFAGTPMGILFTQDLTSL